MPLSEQHERQKKKNYTVLTLVIIFVFVVFCVSIIRMKAGTL